MNSEEFRKECMKWRGFHFVLYPRHPKAKASIDMINAYIKYSGKCAGEGDQVILEDVDLEWTLFKGRYYPALVHFLKQNGLRATIDCIEMWKKGFEEGFKEARKWRA